MSRLELITDLKVIENNARYLRTCVQPGVKMLAVVKADAYGHGSVQVAKSLEAKNLCDCFAVATAEEGARLRSSGIQSEILILGYSDSEEIEIAVQNRLSITVYTKESLLLLKESCQRYGVEASAHLKIETGMHRIGIAPGEKLIELLEVWKNISCIRMSGVFSHFSSADIDQDYTCMQFSKFLAACSAIADYGFTPVRHMAASSAMLDKRYQLDMVRAGIALYGVSDANAEAMLQPAQKLKTHPVRFFRVAAGEKIGYSMKYTAVKDTDVMTLPCGYGDGYPRILSGRASVLVKGKRAPIIGNICMDMLMVDVTGIGEIDETTEVVLMGCQGDERISPCELANLAETIPYEIMLGFTDRVKKTWID